jgi:membrane protease YdiL (CAAX protease family)
MPTDSFADLSSAPFTFSVLKKPEVWGGLLGTMALAVTTAYVAGFADDAFIQTSASTLSPLVAFPVGLGEEALFRGCLQSCITEISNPYIGITLSSLAFGAAHIPNAFSMEKDMRRRYYTFSLPLITTIGAYCGWLTYKNNSLKESVALHTWYDFILFAASSLDSAAATGRPGFVFSTSF